MLKNRVFLVAGSDFLNRQRAVESLLERISVKKKTPLNKQIYYSQDLNLADLKNLLFTFSFDKNKIVIFKESQKLKSQIRSFLRQELENIILNNYLIFEIERDFYFFKSDKRFIKDDFFGYIINKACVIKIASFSPDISIKKFILTLRKKNCSESIHILDDIFRDNKQSDFIGLQILGALTKEFSYLDSSPAKEKYFDLLWETERLLKGGRVKAQLALELFITKLLRPV